MRAGPRLIIDGERFEMLSDHELPSSVSNVAMNGCRFVACQYGMTARRPSERRSVKNVSLTNCRATNNTWIGPVVLEDVEVDGLATGGLCIAWGAVYRHVRIRGACGKLMLSPLNDANNSVEKIREFDRADQEFYSCGEWALDVSEGLFEELDIRNVPADLIRRDPETQVVVRASRVRATQHVWNDLDLTGTPWKATLSNMLQLGLRDKVLVAPRRRKDCSVWVSGLRRLQEAGVAELG